MFLGTKITPLQAYLFPPTACDMTTTTLECKQAAKTLAKDYH